MNPKEIHGAMFARKMAAKKSDKVAFLAVFLPFLAVASLVALITLFSVLGTSLFFIIFLTGVFLGGAVLYAKRLYSWLLAEKKGDPMFPVMAVLIPLISVLAALLIIPQLFSVGKVIDERYTDELF
ncbi:MAG: hypothetical protein FWE86_03105 [Oscillospiraceae bacterium]|nr:hypothetical protein [Oscillospiraceae bacterium]